MVFFKCVGCGAALQTGDEWAGKSARCPFCQAVSPVLHPQLQPANYPKRTSKIKILARFCAYPLIVIVSWSYLFDSLPPPFNTDPDEVRYQELYRERLRLEEQGIKFE